MRGILVDSNVILDVFLNDPIWADWSESKLVEYDQVGILCINAIIYSEISIGFERIEDLETALGRVGFKMLKIPKEALFLAGKAFVRYRQRKGNRTAPLPDFYMGAHAAVTDMELLTRDVTRYQSYFPSVRLITPDSF